MVAKAGDGIGLRVIAIPAVLGSIAIIHFPAVIGIFGAFQKFFCEINRVVQVIIIHVSTVNMYLANEFRP
jgi:hypothetical protein